MRLKEGRIHVPGGLVAAETDPQDANSPEAGVILGSLHDVFQPAMNVVQSVCSDH